jgi:DNA-directed RNA polymerase subunit RPC12/RpoP
VSRRLGGVRRLFWLVVVVGLALVALDLVAAKYVFAPLLGLLIWRVGTASFASLRRGGAHIPAGPPQPVDAGERITYWCGGCGAEVLLLVRGSDVAPRHCGERMTERREVGDDAAGPSIGHPQMGTRVWTE